MPIAAYTVPVNVTAAALWQTLRDIGEQPQRFDPTVDGVRIVERFEGGLVRDVTRHGRSRRERVRYDERHRTVKLELVDDSEYTGSLVCRAEKPTPSSQLPQPRLSFRLDWTPRSGVEDGARAAELSRELERELHAVKDVAEHKAALAAGA